MSQKGTELIVALDYAKGDQAWPLVEALLPLNVIFKVGFELFVSEGPQFVRELVHKKGRVFLDLKFHDIPNTVTRAAEMAAHLRVEMFTLHISGGPEMIKSVRAALDPLPALKPKILGVSVLTSFSEESWGIVSSMVGGMAGAPRGAAVGASVSAMVENAKNWGVDGVVCSAAELTRVKSIDQNLYTVIPGIRPKGTDAGDQARVMTPTEAASLGASAIVVGRPITKAASPVGVAKTILAELGAAVKS